MLTELRIQNFKSWRDTGAMRFAPLTGFFGPNSSGKTSILQFLLMLKQTVESSDRDQVLYLGDERSYVSLGTFSEIAFQNLKYKADYVSFEIDWKSVLSFPSAVAQMSNSQNHFEILGFAAKLRQNQYFVIETENFIYRIGQNYIGIEKDKTTSSNSYRHYKLETNLGPIQAVQQENYQLKPTKFYGFPYEVRTLMPDIDDYAGRLEFNFESVFRDLRYLGPLREYPKPNYIWSGSPVADVGIRGEQTIQALLHSSKSAQMSWVKNDSFTSAKNRLDTERHVAKWLKNLGLVNSFRLRNEARQIYEALVRQTEDSPEVLLTEVGFGISQILPVLTLCYYAPEGSTIILEQPEIHLHPAVQSGLADVFIDVIKNRGIQIILESHSEHLLNRLQRRMAEEQLVPDDVALYFTHMEDGESKLEELKIDEYGNISNWPENFFGDEMGDLVAMTEAAIKRQMQQQGQQA